MGEFLFSRPLVYTECIQYVPKFLDINQIKHVVLKNSPASEQGCWVVILVMSKYLDIRFLNCWVQSHHTTIVLVLMVIRENVGFLLIFLIKFEARFVGKQMCFFFSLSHAYAITVTSICSCFIGCYKPLPIYIPPA